MHRRFSIIQELLDSDMQPGDLVEKKFKNYPNEKQVGIVIERKELMTCIVRWFHNKKVREYPCSELIKIECKSEQ